MLSVEVEAEITTSISTTARHYFSGTFSTQDFITTQKTFTELVVATVGEEC